MQIKKEGSISSQILPRNNAAFPRTQRQTSEINDKNSFINRYVQNKPASKVQAQSAAPSKSAANA